MTRTILPPGAGNPFHYGTPATGDYFTGRRNELQAVVSRMRSEVSVVLISPRRYGKTSLLRRAEERVRRSGASVVFIDVLLCKDLPTLASSLATQALHARPGMVGRSAKAAADFCRRFRAAPHAELGEDGRWRLHFAPHLATADADRTISEVYLLLAEQAEERPSILVLDEFQAITDLGAHLPRLLKGLADTYPRVVLALAGSKHHLMQRMVVDADAPLYGMCQAIGLGPVDDESMVEYLVQRAASGGKPMVRSVAEELISLAGPAPNDIQRLAFEAYLAAPSAIDIEAVRRGLLMTVSHGVHEYAEIWNTRPPGQRRVLGALADAPTGHTSSKAFRERSGVSSTSSVQKAIEALDQAELIVRRDGTWHVADPFFRAWVPSPDVLHG